MSERFSILLATGNPDKLREVRQILVPLGIGVVSVAAYPELAGEAPPETGTTFAANALLKARWCANRVAAVAVADDSGLVVDALGGEPGIHSARYAGLGATAAQNNARLLAALSDVAAPRRTGRFVCSAVLFVPTGVDAGPLAPLVERAAPGSLEEAVPGAPIALEDGVAVAFGGTLEGLLLEAPRGSHGFGYDPLFYLPERGQTTAELEPGEKHLVSHRGQAFRALARTIRSLTAPGGN